MRRLGGALLALAFGAVALSAAELELHFIDVGQGAAVLLRTDRATVLIDAGETNAAADYLSRIGVTRISLAVATHGHADHVGGFLEVFRRFPVDRVWYNGQTHTTRTFERFIDAVLASGAAYLEPGRGRRQSFGKLLLSVLHPGGSAADHTGHLLEKNIVLRADYHRFAVIVTGDAESSAETEMIRSGVPLQATVLQLGHHGSYTSSSAAFLRAVRPEVGVYQAGAANPYGYPHSATLRRVRSSTRARVLGTDTHGTVVIVTDGSSYSVRTERATSRR